MAPPAYRGTEDAARRSVFEESYSLQLSGSWSAALPGWSDLVSRGELEGSPAHYYSGMALVFSPGEEKLSPRIIMTDAQAGGKGLSHYYPNPVGDVLHLALAEGIWEVSLYYMDGRKALSIDNAEGIRQIGCGHLPSGIYLMELKKRDGSGQYIERIIKL